MWKSIVLWWNSGSCSVQAGSSSCATAFHHIPFHCVYTILVTVFIFLFQLWEAISLIFHSTLTLKKKKNLVKNPIVSSLVSRTGSSLVPMWDTGVCNVAFPATPVKEPSPWWEAWFRTHMSFQGRPTLRRSQLYLLKVTMRPCGTEQMQVRRWDRIRGGAWLFAEGGEDHFGRVKKEQRDLKWVCEGTNTDRLQREKSACSSPGKWEKMRRWRSRSSDGGPGDI